MNISKALAVLACTAFMASSISCHHSSSDDTLEYMDGSLSFNLPSFIEAGSQLELIPTGVTYGSDEKIPGFYWYTSENTTKDTTRLEDDPAEITGKFLLEIDEDFVGSLTVTASAFATGYYIRSQASTTNVINKETSLVVPEFSDDDPVFTDDRDGKNYRYTTINGLDWFSQNLSYSGGFPAVGVEIMRDLFGTFYTWDEAVTACPSGWRLPSAEDWKTLATGLGDSEADVHTPFKNIAGKLMTKATFNSEDLWEFTSTVSITAESRFTALPAGYAVIDGKTSSFADFANYAVFWTSEEINPEQAYYRYLYYSSPDVNISFASKTSFAAPVRCVRESL